MLALSELFGTFPSEQASEFLDADDVTGNGGLTLLVPTNKAVMMLTGKPHRSPPSDNSQNIESLRKNMIANQRRTYKDGSRPI
ncbi:hypothetical protein GYMLUDRAFT_47479 [Collybiopsis luxurians FD-317 M1]|uniref:Uncharacterized protein n=1 Tax=Collybiopsis luxurians FD-317 M1 TaxID=944289 RepID=A0A0D0CLN2_9AGAR|nr:hypothetical protein GYMLUDRAFT_47479 [Collybiopsis luxurians FD-317 M1]